MIDLPAYLASVGKGICPHCGAKGRFDKIDSPDKDEIFCDACGEQIIIVDYKGLEKMT